MRIDASHGNPIRMRWSGLEEGELPDFELLRGHIHPAEALTTMLRDFLRLDGLEGVGDYGPVEHLYGRWFPIGREEQEQGEDLWDFTFRTRRTPRPGFARVTRVWRSAAWMRQRAQGYAS